MNKIPSPKLCFPIIVFLTFVFSGFAQDSNKTENDTCQTSDCTGNYIRNSKTDHCAGISCTVAECCE